MAPAMIVFCAFEQIGIVIEEGKKHGLEKSYPLIFCKNYSAQVLKANMKIVNACEYAVVLYRDKLPKFRNDGHMVFNWFNWERDSDTPKIHPTQKPVQLLKQLIQIFTDPGDVVIDPVAGSASTLRACAEIGRSCYGFEIKKEYCKAAHEKMLVNVPQTLILPVSASSHGEKKGVKWMGIRFKHSESAAIADIATFARWEDGSITTDQAIEKIKKHNELTSLTEEEFIQEAKDLGFKRRSWSGAKMDEKEE